jgi:hypothetical protein
MGRWVGVALGFAILCAGCGGKGPAVFPVKGQLFWQGKPAVGALVYFHSITETVDNQNPAKGPRPRGMVGEDGTFEIATFGKKDGAPAGRYQVSVVWTKSTGNGDEAMHLLPTKYMNPDTADLPIVEVGDQPIVLEPFKLTS